MVEIGIEEAKKFLNEINKGEKVAIIHHDDTDGFVSAILLYEFLEKRGVKDIGHFCFSIGDNQRSIIEKVSSYETILIADLAPNAITNVLEAIKNKKVLYIDHHKKDVEIPEKILEYRTESKISASRSIFTMLEPKRLRDFSITL
jgi:single-stranded DNA-specific DHH superfamily exonuclease